MKILCADIRFIPKYIIMTLTICLVNLANYSLAKTDTVANVNFVRGTVAAQLVEQQSRLLGKDSDVYSKDNVQTGDRSFAVLNFEDTTKLTIRPNSNISIEEYKTTGMEQRAQLVLHAGGARVGGSISEHLMIDGYQVDTGDALIQPRDNNSEFSIRKCTEDCQAERDKLLALANKVPVAQIVEIKGQVTAASSDGSHYRKLKNDAPIYNYDKLKSDANSHAVLSFSDGSKFTLVPNTIFSIDQYQFNKPKLDDKSSYNLVKGGIRILTGLIGKENTKDFEMKTPVATLGIRGTGFDVFCREDCVNEVPVRSDLIEQGEEPGLYSYVWEGSIQQKNNAGTFDLGLDDSNYISSMESVPHKLKSWPDVFQGKPLDKPGQTPSVSKQSVNKGDSKDLGDDLHPKMDVNHQLFDAPRPDMVDEEQFNSPSLSVLRDLPQGTYISVHNGEIKLFTLGGEFLLVKSDSVYIDKDGALIYLNEQLNYLARDPYPRPLRFDGKLAEFGTFSLLAESVEIANEAQLYECIVE